MTSPSEGNVDITNLIHAQKVKHPPSAWTNLAPGANVFLRGLDLDIVGIVESRTIDGLIIWIRNDLNERKMVHFEDCLSVRVLK